MTDRPEKREAEPYCKLCGDSEEAIIHHLDEDDDVGHKFEPAQPTSGDTAKERCTCQNQADEDGAYCPICGKLKGVMPTVSDDNQSGTSATGAVISPAVTASELDNPETWRGIEKTYEPVTASAKCPSGWISVKERVPKFHRQVLSFDGKRQWVDYIESVSEPRWHTRRDITHWCELPEPPAALASLSEPKELSAERLMVHLGLLDNYSPTAAREIEAHIAHLEQDRANYLLVYGYSGFEREKRFGEWGSGTLQAICEALRAAEQEKDRLREALRHLLNQMDLSPYQGPFLAEALVKARAAFAQPQEPAK